MNKYVKLLIAIAVGLIAGALLNGALIKLGSMVIPPPAGADMMTPEGLAAAMPSLTAGHFVFPFLAHALGTLLGAYLATRIAPKWGRLPAMLIGVAFLIGGVMMAYQIPAPTWFEALDVIGAYIPFAWLAYVLAGSPKKALQ